MEIYIKNKKFYTSYLKYLKSRQAFLKKLLDMNFFS